MEIFLQFQVLDEITILITSIITALLSCIDIDFKMTNIITALIDGDGITFSGAIGNVMVMFFYCLQLAWHSQRPAEYYLSVSRTNSIIDSVCYCQLVRINLQEKFITLTYILQIQTLAATKQ